MILGPLAETQFRRAMTISNGDWSVFYTHKLSLVLLILAFIGLAGPHIWAFIEHRRRRGPEHDLQDDGAVVDPALQPDGGAGRGVFRGIVEEVEQRLLEQHRIDFQHRQIRRQLELDLVVRQDAPGAAQRRADNLAEVVQGDVRRYCARLELGHAPASR